MALATLSIDLVAKIAQFQKDLGEASRAAQKWAADTKASADAVAGSLKVVAGAFLAGLSVDMLKDSFRGTVDMLDQLDDLSEKYGIAAESVSAYRYASEVAGTTTEAFVTGLNKLGKNATEAAGGNKELSRAFAAIGVSVRDANGDLKTGDALLLDVADRFATYEDSAGKAALAQKLFGKSGADMLPLLNKGREGIIELTKEGRALGAVYGNDLAKAAGDLNDNFKKLELAGEAFRVKVFSGIIPSLVELTNWFIKAKANGTVLSEFMERFNKGRKIGNDEIELAAQSKAIQALTDEAVRLSAALAKTQNPVLRDTLSNSLDRTRRLLKQTQDDAVKTGDRLKGLIAPEIPELKAPPTPKGNAPIVGGAPDPAAEKAMRAAGKLYDDLNAKIAERASAIDAELYSQEKLTDGQKFALDVVTKLANKEVQLSDVQKQAVVVSLERLLADEQALRTRTQLREAADADFKAELERIDAIEKETLARVDANKSLADEIRFLGMTAAQVEAVKIMREEAALAQERGNIETQKALGAGAGELIGLRESADQLEKNIALRKQYLAITTAERTDPTKGAELAVRDYLRAIDEAGVATRDAVTSSMQALESDLNSSLSSGKLNVKSFISTVIAEFNRLTIIRPLMKGLLGSSEQGGMGGGGLISGLLGMVTKGLSGMFATPSGVSADGSLVDFNIPESATANGGGGGFFDSIGSFLKGSASGGPQASAASYAPTYNVGSDISRSEVYSLLAQQGEAMRAQSLQDMQGMRNA